MTHQKPVNQDQDNKISNDKFLFLEKKYKKVIIGLVLLALLFWAAAFLSFQSGYIICTIHAKFDILDSPCEWLAKKTPLYFFARSGVRTLKIKWTPQYDLEIKPIDETLLIILNHRLTQTQEGLETLIHLTKSPNPNISTPSLWLLFQHRLTYETDNADYKKAITHASPEIRYLAISQKGIRTDGSDYSLYDSLLNDPYPGLRKLTAQTATLSDFELSMLNKLNKDQKAKLAQHLTILISKLEKALKTEEEPIVKETILRCIKNNLNIMGTLK